jgi:ABC-type multidrug transport system fused ATPase/permease subunit
MWVQVLLLDEATSALDEKTEALFQRVLEEKFADTTILCIAHRLETLRWCRTRFEMGSGKLVSISQLPLSDAGAVRSSAHSS